VAGAGFGAVMMIVIRLVVVVMISIGVMRANREFSWYVGEFVGRCRRGRRAE
jgi:hypothetical protein